MDSRVYKTADWQKEFTELAPKLIELAYNLKRIADQFDYHPVNDFGTIRKGRRRFAYELAQAAMRAANQVGGQANILLAASKWTYEELAAEWKMSEKRLALRRKLESM